VVDADAAIGIERNAEDLAATAGAELHGLDVKAE
jgi:hypothetical protein